MDTSRYRSGMERWSPSGRPGLRPHNRLLRGSQLPGTVRHYCPSPVRASCLMTRTRQDLPLSRTVIDRRPDESSGARSYVGRFACDWHRLAARFARVVQPRTRTDSMTSTVGHRLVTTKPRSESARRGVAAAVATASTVSPLASSARWASRAVAPVVSTSSQTTTRRSVRRASAAGESPQRPARTAHRARQVGGPRGRVEPGLVGDPDAQPEQPQRADVVPLPPQPRGGAAGDRPGRVVAAGADGGRPRRARAPARRAGRAAPASSTAARTARASRSDSGPRSPCMARSLWPRTRARAASA